MMDFHSNRTLRRSDPRRGSALLLSVVMVGVISIMAAAVLQLSATTSRRQVRSADRKHAFYLAEAGLSDAVNGVYTGRTGNIGSMESPAAFGDGLFWVEATDLGANRIQLESTGMVGSGRAQLSLVVERGTRGITSLGFFALEDLTLEQGSFVDSYDSSAGPYDPPAAQTPGETGGREVGGWNDGVAPDPEYVDVYELAQVGSNGVVTLLGGRLEPTEIHGQVTPGVGAELVLEGNVEVTGSTEAAVMAHELPPIDAPGLELEPAISHPAGVPLILGPGELGCESLTLQQNSECLIRGPVVLVTGNLTANYGAQIGFDTSEGPVTIFVIGDLDLRAGSQVVTAGQDPSLVTVFVTGEVANLNGVGPFYGVLYAPEGRVEVGAGVEVFGALVARWLALSPGARLHFDLNLARLAESEAWPQVLSWRIVEMSDPKGSGSNDPFALLGVNRADLDAPADAHDDVWLAIDYEAVNGSTRNYEGWESVFDWDDVEEEKAWIRRDRPGGTILRQSWSSDWFDWEGWGDWEDRGRYGRLGDEDRGGRRGGESLRHD